MLSSAPQWPCWTPWCTVGGLQSVLVLTWAQGSPPPGRCCLQLSAVLTCQHCVLSSEAQALGVKSEGGAAEGQGGGGTRMPQSVQLPEEAMWDLADPQGGSSGRSGALEAPGEALGRNALGILGDGEGPGTVEETTWGGMGRTGGVSVSGRRRGSGSPGEFQWGRGL